MILFSIKFWIIFASYYLDFTLSDDQRLNIDSLTKKFETAFSNLKQILSTAKYTEKIVNVKKESLSENEIREILAKSKSDTEHIIRKTNKVVDNIQSELTKSYNEYSMTPPNTYVLECGNASYIFYYRAKSLKVDSFADVTNCTAQKLPLEKDPFLNNILTNRQTATAHVPTNVYDASREIQGVANWTENLDGTFRKAKDDFQLKWQFFCSNTGLFKIFPGIRWNIQIEDSDRESSIVDFFDCRSEQWYLEATAYPKKVMIMVDKSGSMKGRRKIIANHTIYEILNTLTENDFFNILLFTKEYFFADNSTNGILMHATDKNKKFIIDQLGAHFNPDGIAEYDVGLKASFNILRNDKINESDSKYYNYLLMIITDGSPMPYQELIDEHNKDVGARIFTYLIGQGATERDAVTSMACKNRGFAVEIATLADVKENVQKYLNVVARKNAVMRNAFNVWTGVHQMQMQPTEELVPVNNTSAAIPITSTFNPNSFSMTFAPNVTGTFSTDFLTTLAPNTTVPAQPAVSTKIEIVKDKPIKLFVTASKAAFDETNATAQLNYGNLLGAAGVDVPISEFIKTAPFWKIGVNAYLFGVTSNGFVLFHPKFMPQYRKFVKYFYRNVDISELEIEHNMVISYIRNDQIVQSNNSLRTALLNQSPSSPMTKTNRLTTYQIVDDFKTAFKIERDYFLVGIDKTSYKFGLAMPVNQTVPKYTENGIRAMSMESFSTYFNMSYEKFRNQCSIVYANKSGQGITLKNYEFCNMNHHIATLYMKSPVCALIDILTNESSLQQCISNSADISTYLSNLFSEIQMTSGFPAIWAGINGMNLSVQQVFSMHHFGLTRYYNYESLSYEHFITNHSLGIDDPLYQETILVAQKMKINEVLVARPLPNEVVKKNLAPSSLVFTITTPLVSNGVYVGIIGVQAKHDFFQSILMDNSVCSNNTIRECYVITESGLILVNNQDIRHNGNNLREANCALMESLVINNVFEEQSLYDFQGLCVNLAKPTDSFSSRLINPFTLIFRFTLWLIYECIIMIQNFSLTTFLWSLSFEEDNYVHHAFDETSSTDVSAISTDSSAHKSISNISPPATKSSTKSKRQHERDVKNLLKNEIQQCSKNHHSSENDMSGCIQKAVSNICRQDKAHVNPSTDQHVEKVTPQNFISHCATACSILHSEYPKIWQEQDDCKQPLKLCHKVTQTFTSIFPSSFLIKLQNKNSIPVSNPVTYYQSERDIILNTSPYDNNNNNNNNNKEESSAEPIKNGTICGASCSANKWYIKHIKNTNLLLVVLDKSNVACSCECSGGFGKNVEITRKVNDSIENPYIVKPSFFSEFVNFTKIENSTVCADGDMMSSIPSRLLMVFSVVLSVLLAY